MAKDPAILWYWNDWQGGTMTMTRQAKGAYMDLLTAQFNSGHLTETQIRTLLGQDQGLWVTVLREKFLVDGDGRYYNERLDQEKLRRRAFSEKQSENGKLGGRPKKARQNPTLNPNFTNKEDEVETATEVEFVKGGSGENRQSEFLNNQKWKEDFCMAKGLQMTELEAMMKDFISDCDLKGEYVDSYKRYFTNLYNKNGKTHQRTIPGGNGKPNAGEEKIRAYANWPRKSG